MSDHCQNCTVRGDLEACRLVCERETIDPCDVPLSWGAAARISALKLQLQRTVEADANRIADLTSSLSDRERECDRLRTEADSYRQLFDHRNMMRKSAEAALSAAREDNERLQERIAGQKELIRTTPAAALVAIAKGINTPMACGHGIDCWDDSNPGKEHCVWCSLAAAREAGEETGVRNFADWLSEVMLNIRGDIDPRIRYRLPDGRIASGTAVHACDRFLASRASERGEKEGGE